MERKLTPGPGKTAPRLIADLLDYDPRYLVRNGRNLLAGPAPMYKGKPVLRKGPNDCRHTLMKKESQTDAPKSNTERPGEQTIYCVATYCTECRYHFSITVDYRQQHPSQHSCNLLDEENPLHHLRLVESSDTKDRLQNGISKYDTVKERHRFVCTGEHCPCIVTIKIYPPRLGKAVIAGITDTAKVYMRGQREIQKDPERYQGQSPLAPYQALGYLRQYLVDAKTPQNPGTKPKRISKRNKKFILALGDECNHLLQYLDFVEEDEETEDDEEVASFWLLPVYADHNRIFLEDVLLELELLISRRPPAELGEHKDRVLLVPQPALKDIQRSLAFYDYPVRSRLVDLSTEEHPYYSSLGAVDNFTDELLIWAYDRQCSCDPTNKPYYLDCLEDLAKGRGSPDLHTKVAMAVSAGELSLKAIHEAYDYFRLDPSTLEGDGHIMGLYKSRIESAPRQKEEARECLLVIAKHRDSKQIEELANDTTMTFAEALEYLNVSADTASDSIEASAVAIAIDGDTSKVARALQVISQERKGDWTLMRAAATMTGTGGFALDVGDAYNRLQVTTRNVPDETIWVYYQSLTSGAAPGSRDSFTEALRAIALDRQSNFLLRKLEDPNADIQASTTEPVGLDNIGNTCYLNSLLQYYYTIKPVRDMVINFESHRMPLDEEHIRKKKVGGRLVDKAEIIKAQKFVEELHNLFENLKTASTKSIKPTRDLAELTIFSTATEANFRRYSISSPSGPPNLSSIMDGLEGPVFGPQWPPPRPSSPTSSTVAENDVEMTDGINDTPIGNGDDSSEATLVDDHLLGAGDSEGNKDEELPSYEEISGTELSQDNDADMVNNDISNATDQVLPTTPEKPPPIPPRNKSGLVIQTNENKSLIPNDDLWKFGTQQDVTEVIGNVTFRLQCAIKPTSLEPLTEEQIDIIRDTFYGATTTYTQKAQTLEKKIEAWSTIIVFPGKGVIRDLYEAIDVVFDQQIVEVDRTTCPQFSSISKLPPVLQIQIQRTDFDQMTQRSSKNTTSVRFPETIYLDRYIDNADPESAVMRRRRQTWEWKSELRRLEARQVALQNTNGEISVPDSLLALKAFTDTLQEQEVDGVEFSPDLRDILEERIADVATEFDEVSKEIASLKRNLQEQFTDMREHEYKLHSVFIHRGEAGGGHYWIYIYDFEHDIWREYNDAYVTEVRDRRRIFDQQGISEGTPYYLVYVRSADKTDLVDAVCRDVQAVQASEVSMTDAPEHWNSQADGGASLYDDADNGEVRHVEHAKPRPLMPKPVNSGWGSEWDQKQTASIDDGHEW